MTGKEMIHNSVCPPGIISKHMKDKKDRNYVPVLPRGKHA